MEEKKKKNTIKIVIVLAIVIVLIGIGIFVDRQIRIYQVKNALSSLSSFDENDSNNLSNSIFKTQSNEKAEINTDIVIEDFCEFNVKEAKFAKKVIPSNTSGYYTYYEVKTEGNTYLDVKISIKNLTSSPITASDLGSVTIKYDNKYEYSSFSVLEDGDTGFDYTNITSVAPITTKQFHFLAEVPEEVETSGKPILLLFSANSTTYEIPLR